MAGGKITIQNGKLNVPDQPIIPFIEGDGTGADIWAASVRVMDAAVEKAYGGKKKIEWMEVLAGEKAFNKTGNWLPDETLAAFNEYLEDIASSPAIVVLTIHSNGHVEGNWLVVAYQDFYGYIDYYMAIPFQGTVTELQDGRLMIEAGPLAFVMQSTTNALKHNIYFFDGNNDLAFGKITFK